MTENKKQNAFVFYLCMLVYMVPAAIARVIAFAPLACLFVLEGPLKLLALLCPVLVVLLVLPLRYSFAQAMAQNPRRFSFCKALCFQNYGAKLKAAVVHALSVAKWGIPLAGMAGFAVYAVKKIEYLDMYDAVKEMGDSCMQLVCDVSAWLNGLLGTPVVEMTANNFMMGVCAVAAIVGLGVLILLCGVMRNSASRYVWAKAVDEGKKPAQEIRRCIKGRRMRQFGRALVNLLLWAPFAVVLVMVLKDTLSGMSTVMMMAMVTRKLPVEQLMEAAAPCAIAFGALYLPLLPLRRWNNAAFALGQPKVKAEKKVSA